MNFEMILVSVIAAFFQMLAVCASIFSQIKIKKVQERIKLMLFIWVYCVIVFFFITNQLRFVTSIVVMSVLIYFVLKIKDKKVI